MFPDLARDDVFRLETARLWLRWPRAADAPMIHRFCSLWEVARYTARIPHPYPPGSAERFIYAAREGNASGRDLTLVITPKKGKLDAIGSISLESRGADRLTLGFVLTPEHWGGPHHRGDSGDGQDRIFLTNSVEILANVRVENESSRHVLETCGFEVASTGLKGAPARGGLVECHTFRLTREAWAAAMAIRRQAFDHGRVKSGRPA